MRSQLIWRTGDRLLAADGTLFVLLEPTGSVIRWYGVKSYSDEDDLWIWDHHVDGDRLYARTRVEHGGDPATVRDDEVVLEGLAPVSDPATRALVAAVLAAADAEREETRVREAARLREDRARADAHTAATAAAYAQGDEFARAHRALSGRVHAYGDPVAQSLLDTLMALAQNHAQSAVITAYARSCRLACFEHDVPELDEAHDGDVRRVPSLSEQIAAHARQLECAADDQDAVDARGNAVAYYRAAKAMARLAKLLA